MTDYCTVASVKAYLGGEDTFGGDTSDTLLQQFVSSCSRLFDRETEKPTGYFAAQIGVTRRYSGTATAWLDIDDFSAITAVTMSTQQNRADAVALNVTNPNALDYVQIHPLIGPPFNQLFLLRGWLPDAYNVGNIAVTGNTITPDEIALAVTIWAAYLYKARQAGFSDETARVGASGGGGGPRYGKAIPAHTQQIIERYTTRSDRTVHVGLIDGGDTGRQSKWLGWMTRDV